MSNGCPAKQYNSNNFCSLTQYLIQHSMIFTGSKSSSGVFQNENRLEIRPSVLSLFHYIYKQIEMTEESVGNQA